MSQRKQIEHQTFSNIVMARNIRHNKEQLEQIAIYFAFEDINNPRLETKYASLYEEGKKLVANLINELGD